MNPTAARVRDRILACSTDEEAALLASIIVGGALQHDLEVHREVIQKQVDLVVGERREQVSKALARGVIAKRNDPAAMERLLALAVIAKAAGDPRGVYDESEVKRDEAGRFSAVEGRTFRARINYNDDRTKPLKNSTAEAFLKIPKDGHGNLSGADKARFQQAYSQVGQMIAPYAKDLTGESLLHMTYEAPNGKKTTHTMEMPSNPEKLDEYVLRPADFQRGGKLIEVGVSVSPNLSVRGAAFNLVGALGEQPALLASRGLERNPDTKYFKGSEGLASFAETWNDKSKDAGNRGGLFSRISQGSGLLSRLVGNHAPMKVRMALEAADFVGQYGAEAEKVVGPQADTAAYRYRGVEKTPSPVLQQSVNALRSKHPQTPAGQDAARRELIYGTPREVVTRAGVRAEPTPGPLVGYLQRKLADPTLLNLQRQSGVIPPSQGIIVDRKGQVVTEAVGYGEDWYLPFNLKTLSKVKGGEYVRTRAWGGPTTEDIYAGLVSGARAVTVVSHSGTFTIEFDDSFRGSRRYNDKAARMVKRYGHLLDAVKSKEVTLTGIPADRMAELQTKAAAVAGSERDNPAEYRKALNDLRLDERKDPQMSGERVRSLAEEFLVDVSLDRGGEPGDWAKLATDYVDGQVAAEKAPLAPYESFDEAGVRADAAARVRTPEQVIQVIGQGANWDKFLAKKQAEYVAEQSPLDLNGQGYDKSMKALQEQFPYYIKSVNWEPEKPHQNDVGYIKPRFNRPAMALSGYYDTTIEGAGKERTMAGAITGKRTADQTRWQNGMDPYKAEQRFGERPKNEETPDAGGSPGGRRGGPSGGPIAQQLTQATAIGALYDHVRNQKTGRTRDAQAAYDVQAALNHPEGGPAMRSELPTVFGKTREQFMADYASRPEATKAALLKDVAKIKTQNLFDLDPTIVDKVVDPTKAERGSEFSVLAAKANPAGTFDFGEKYDAGNRSQSYVIEARQVLGQMGMGNKPFEDPNLDSEMGEEITKGITRLETAQRSATAPKFNETVVAKRVENAVRVRQLLRRHKQAVEDEKAAAAAPATTGGDQVTVISVPQGGNVQLPGGGSITGFQGSGATMGGAPDPNKDPDQFWAQMRQRQA